MIAKYRSLFWGLSVVLAGLSAYSFWPPDQKIKLGLDLKGGVHLVLEVVADVAQAQIDFAENAQAPTAAVVRAALAKEGFLTAKLEGEPPDRPTSYRMTLSLAELPREGEAGETQRMKLREQVSQRLVRVAGAFGAAAARVESVRVYVLPKGLTLSNAVDRALEVVRRRVDGLGVAETVIQRQGDRWIVVQLPGIKDPAHARRLIGRTALLEFKIVDRDREVKDFLDEDGKPQLSRIPAGLVVLPQKDGGYLLLEDRNILTGNELKDAAPRMSGDFGRPEVSFELHKDAARDFARATGANKGRQMAIILDGEVVSAPVIQDRISGGQGVINGVSLEEAKDLSLVLRAGALPAPVEIVFDQEVGPTLGQDSIQAGKISALIGLAAVMLFMAIYYRLSGVIAVVGMLLNLVYLLGGMAAMDWTMTLPGIAGVILTMGMSVDSNVLIFERIREEMRSGKTVKAAIDAGYDRAFLTVLDSHVTTLLTAAVLFFLGSGPIKGFAVTLSVGVSISLFTALVITRLIFDIRKQYRSLSI